MRKVKIENVVVGTAASVDDSLVILEFSYLKAAQTLVLNVNNTVYAYSKVPYAVYQKFLRAGSRGVFFNSNIRGKYTSTKVG